MQITKPQSYRVPDTHFRRVWEDIYKLVNRNISYGHQVNGQDQNIDGMLIEVPDTGLANTEFAVTHNLGRVPLFYDIKYMSLATQVFDSGTAWTASQIYLKSTTAHVKIRIFVH